MTNNKISKWITKKTGIEEGKEEPQQQRRGNKTQIRHCACHNQNHHFQIDFIRLLTNCWPPNGYGEFIFVLVCQLLAESFRKTICVGIFAEDSVKWKIMQAHALKTNIQTQRIMNEQRKLIHYLGESASNWSGSILSITRSISSGSSTDS